MQDRAVRHSKVGKLVDWHLITSEYPPQCGGVSDYTGLIASGLACKGDEVHVWCPGEEQRSEVRSQRSEVRRQTSEVRDQRSECEGHGAKSKSVNVHRELGRISPADLRRVGRMLDEFPAPQRLLVQWVPHGYGYRAMNLPFCLWLWNRARRGDVVEVMAHECFLPFKGWALKQNVAALVQRLMTMFLLRAARRIWMSIPAWEKHWRPLALGRRVEFRWLPVPSNITVTNDPPFPSQIRAQFDVNGGPVLGHFGTYGRHDRTLLGQTLPLLLGNGIRPKIILMGRDSDSMREELIKARPELAGAIHATGTLDADDLSRHLSACDVMLQPCQDGVSTRRGTVMAALSHGRPIVTTTGRLTEPIWQESQAVVLVPDGDVRAIANETQRLLSDEIERERLSGAARRLYQEKFDVKHVIAALREPAR